MLWHLLATLLLAAPDGCATPPCLFPLLAPLVRAEAERNEILDVREEEYLLARAGCWGPDLAILRSRWRDLADAPPLSDCRRLPPAVVCEDALDFNRRCQECLAWRAVADPRRDYFPACEDLAWRGAAWNALEEGAARVPVRTDAAGGPQVPPGTDRGGSLLHGRHAGAGRPRAIPRRELSAPSSSPRGSPSTPHSY